MTVALVTSPQMTPGSAANPRPGCRWIKRNDERERAKQLSNSDGIEHDKFVGRHGVLTQLRASMGASPVLAARSRPPCLRFDRTASASI
jgi:hypothetical protein